MTPKASYLFGDSGAERERQRLLAVQQEFDPATFARLERLGVRPGWKCLEVGCGAGSILRWLSEQVGASGRVVGLDLDIRAVGGFRAENVELRQGDVAQVALEENAFDLIHARFVFIHVQQRELAIANVLRALKPGGWLLLEEPDFGPAGPAFEGAAAETIAHVYEAQRRLYQSTGGDPFIGRHLADWLQRHGLAVTGAEASAALWRGGGSRAKLRRRAVEQLWSRLLATQMVTEEELQQFLKLSLDPAIWGFDYTTVAVWGCGR